MAESYVKVTDPPSEDKESKDLPRESDAKGEKVLHSSESKADLQRLPTGGSQNGDKSSPKPGMERQTSKLGTKKKTAKANKADLDAQTKLFSDPESIFSCAYSANSSKFFEWVEKAGVEVVQTIGPVGECPFLILYLIHSPAHLKIAETLINEHDPKLIYSEYKQFRSVGDAEVECPIYYGETALHLAVVNKNAQLVDFLLGTQKRLHERGECLDKDLLKMPALGSFFAPPIEKGPCYYGQVPLGFAACTANVALCDKLIHEWKADLQFEDSYGNNILHLLAIHNLPDMFTYVLQKEEKSEAKSQAGYVPLSRRQNKDGDTPLAVAARLGNKLIFGTIIESSKVTVWTYGPIEMIKFPLAELDTLDLKHVDKLRKGEESESSDHEGTINTLIREGSLELLMQNVLIDILDNKWTRYAFRRYLWRCAKQTVLILSVTLSLILGFPDPCNYPFETDSEIATSSFRILFEAIVMFMVLTKGWAEANEMREAGLKDYYGDVGVAFLENALSSSYCFFFVIAFIVRIVGISRRAHFLSAEGVNSTTIYGPDWGTEGIPGNNPDIEEFNSLVGHVDILVQFIAVFLIYLYAVTLLLGFSLTGPFVIMISRMMASDVTRWSVVFIVMWMGFATTFLALQSVPRQIEMTGWDQMWTNLVGLYYILMGDGDLDEFVVNVAQDWSLFFDVIAKILIAGYSVLMAVMLLNLLIAMMMDTFAEIKETTQIQYMQYKAQIISSLEAEMGAKDWQSVTPYWIMDNGEPWLQMQIKNETFLQQSKSVTIETLPPPVERSGDEAFAEADVNNDGEISKSELAAHEARFRAQVEAELQQRYGHLFKSAPQQDSSSSAGFVNVNELQGDFHRPNVFRMDGN